ncbi:ABC transporter ATP-binding protein [Actinomadura sp. SCN-SB]|uniref:ABC transporter ATP-binding protein n=1 Tax=Actinomadura sp. SCN-SB TaxID=3373092 RepID=UPI0037518C12
MQATTAREHGSDVPARPGEHAVEIRALSKRFRRRDGTVVPAIDEVELLVEPGEIVVLLGPSGCGKTTLLRSVAGLETPESGRISVGGRVVFDAAEKVDMPAERRGLSMVFQSYALWPHMTAARNVRYPLENRRGRRMSRKEMAAKVQRTLELVGMGGLGEQYPAQLSGGQQQRVALARALVNDSDVVLFDEPLSNVDAKVREQLRTELLATQRRLGFTALFVTHDQGEAMELATRIAVLDQGRVQQIGTPTEVYARPATEYVAKFIGNTNELSGTWDEASGSYTTALGAVRATKRGISPACLLWRPEHCSLHRERPTSGNGLEGRVVAVLYLGTHTEYLVRSGDVRSRVWVSGRNVDFQEGDDVWIGIPEEEVMVYPTGAEVSA